MRQDSTSLLETCTRQEEAFQFDRFTREDALQLGLKLHENAKKYGGGVAIEITINGLSVFRYVPEGAGRNNLDWLARKANTVTVFGRSSLGVMAQFEAAGITAADEKLDERAFALGGGGFPLKIRGTGVIGVIAVSGLPHLDDHQLIVDTLRQVLGA